MSALWGGFPLIVIGILVVLLYSIKTTARIGGTVVIARPLDDVFAFVSDPRHIPRWNPRVHAVTLDSGERVGVGAHYRYEVRGAGTVVPCSAEVIAYEPGREIVTAARIGARAKTVGGYRFAPRNGGTCVEQFGTARVTLAHALILRLVGAKRSAANLDRMKHALEG